MAHLGFSDTYGSSSVAVKALFNRGERDLGSFVVVQVTDEGSPLFREVVNVLSRSECGSFETAPDPLLDWCYARRTEDVFNPLPEPPSKERLAWFRWLMEYLSNFAINRNSLYALLQKETRKVVSAAIVGPPRTVPFDRSLDEMGVNLRKAGMELAIEILTNNRRMKSLGVWQHKNLPGDGFGNFLYISVFATAPECQGQGCGTVLIGFLGDVADADGVETYLETAGEKNTTFYAKKGGYQEVARENLGNFTYEGGAVSMRRLPRQTKHSLSNKDSSSRHVYTSSDTNGSSQCSVFSSRNQSGPLRFYCKRCNEHRSNH